MSTTEELIARNRAAMHAVQSGVAARMAVDPKEVDPKHLRTGMNSALINVSALANLLIQTGVISERQFLEAIAVGAEEEKARYEEWLSEHYGSNVILG